MYYCLRCSRYFNDFMEGSKFTIVVYGECVDSLTKCIVGFRVFECEYCKKLTCWDYSRVSGCNLVCVGAVSYSPSFCTSTDYSQIISVNQRCRYSWGVGKVFLTQKRKLLGRRTFLSRLLATGRVPYIWRAWVEEIYGHGPHSIIKRADHFKDVMYISLLTSDFSSEQMQV